MSPSTRPRIAIDAELSPEGGPEIRLRQRYAEAVWRAGGMPIVLPSLPHEEFREELVATVDGILFSGGDDFDTTALGLGPVHPSAKPVPPEKQAFDIGLAHAVLAAGIPTLGICYGMQLMALACGATLHQHLPDDLPMARVHSGGVRHEVLPVQGSKLAAALGIEPVEVISRHHQALHALPARGAGGGWIVSAHDDQGLIEAIEWDTPGSFALGVQWHPELSLDSPAEPLQMSLFRALVAAAGHSARRRDPSLEVLPT